LYKHSAAQLPQQRKAIGKWAFTTDKNPVKRCTARLERIKTIIAPQAASIRYLLNQQIIPVIYLFNQ